MCSKINNRIKSTSHTMLSKALYIVNVIKSYYLRHLYTLLDAQNNKWYCNLINIFLDKLFIVYNYVVLNCKIVTNWMNCTYTTTKSSKEHRCFQASCRKVRKECIFHRYTVWGEKWVGAVHKAPGPRTHWLRCFIVTYSTVCIKYNWGSFLHHIE